MKGACVSDFLLDVDYLKLQREKELSDRGVDHPICRLASYGKFDLISGVLTEVWSKITKLRCSEIVFAMPFFHLLALDVIAVVCLYSGVRMYGQDLSPYSSPPS